MFDDQTNDTRINEQDFGSSVLTLEEALQTFNAG